MSIYTIPQKVYGFSYKNGGGFYGKIVKRKNSICLAVKIDEKESFILEKYDCRIIIANAKQILSKCTLKEFFNIISQKRRKNEKK